VRIHSGFLCKYPHYPLEQYLTKKTTMYHHYPVEQYLTKNPNVYPNYPVEQYLTKKSTMYDIVLQGSEDT
jgi:hypothetical protein